MREISVDVRWVLQYNLKIRNNNNNKNQNISTGTEKDICRKNAIRENHEFLLLVQHITFKFERSSVDLCWKVAKIVINEKFRWLNAYSASL